MTSSTGGTDGKPLSTGHEGKLGGRNSPTVLNAAFRSVQFWDGRAPSLEEQAKGPIVNPVEMGMPDHHLVEQEVKDIVAFLNSLNGKLAPQKAPALPQH
ncbi:cytochrome-c peroxidase [Bdellovibrionota bacterium FG-1]